MPQHVVAVVVHVDAGIERGRHAFERLLIGPELVERMGERVHPPGVLRVPLDAALGPARRLFAVALLFEHEGMQAQHERVLGQSGEQGVRQLAHVGEASLEEPHQIEPLGDRQVGRPGGEVGAHGGFGVAGAKIHIVVERRHQALLALRTGGGDMARAVGHGRARASANSLLDEQRRRQTGMGDGEPGIPCRRVAEEIHRPVIPGQKARHAQIERGDGVLRAGGKGKPVGVEVHGGRPALPLRRPV